MRSEAGRRAHFTQPFGPIPMEIPEKMSALNTYVKPGFLGFQPFDSIYLRLLHQPKVMDQTVLNGERADGRVG